MQREISGVTFSYIKKSQYHDTCIPSHQRPVPPVQPPANPPTTFIDVVTEDKCWKNYVANEQRSTRQWSENWGFLLNYDSKGCVKEVVDLPEYEGMLSKGPVPNTNSGVYGSRLKTENGLKIVSLENSLAASNRKKKLSSEMICY